MSALKTDFSYNKIKEQFEKMVLRYKRKFRIYGWSYKSLRWKTEEAMIIRHQELIKDIDISGKTILDVGCGFGDIIKTLEQKAKKEMPTTPRPFQYLGVDVVTEFINVAKKKYPKYKFSVRNYFEKPFKRNFDIILCCGALNSNFGEETMCFRKNAIKTMFKRCNYALSFNMAGSYPPPQNTQNSTIYFANSLEILKYCLSLTRKVIFRHHYRRNEFTIVMFKQENIQTSETTINKTA
jgi:SAM-dependent methyltransferase